MFLRLIGNAKEGKRLACPRNLTAENFPAKTQRREEFLSPRISRISRIFSPRRLANFLAADVADERRFRKDAGNALCFARVRGRFGARRKSEKENA